MVPAVESKTVRWPDCVAGFREKKYAYRILVGKPEGDRQHGRYSRTLEDNIKIGRYSYFLQATKALRVSRGIYVLFLGPRHSRWRWGVSPTPRPPVPPVMTRYPLCRRLGGNIKID